MILFKFQGSFKLEDLALKRIRLSIFARANGRVAIIQESTALKEIIVLSLSTFPAQFRVCNVGRGGV